MWLFKRISQFLCLLSLSIFNYDTCFTCFCSCIIISNCALFSLSLTSSAFLIVPFLYELSFWHELHFLYAFHVQFFRTWSSPYLSFRHFSNWIFYFWNKFVFLSLMNADLTQKLFYSLRYCMNCSFYQRFWSQAYKSFVFSLFLCYFCPLCLLSL